MNSLRRLLRNVPVLRFGAAATLAVLIATSALLVAPALFGPPALAVDLPAVGPPFAASPGTALALPAGVTPQQAEAVRQAIQSGAPLPPEAQRALEAHPELKNQLPPDVKQKVEGKLGEKGSESAAKTPGSDASPESFGLLPPYDWRTSQYVGRLFSTRLYDNEVRTLPHFGHDLFAPHPGAASLENMPPAPDYVVGPGDEIVVKMWGRVEGIQRMTVDRDGKIFFPKFGSLYVAGKTFSEVKSFLHSKVSTIAEVSSDVTLGQMKGIRVSVIGEVRLPGWYNVSSLHTALQVLAMAGGVKDIGSLRRIEVRRGGQVVGDDRPVRLPPEGGDRRRHAAAVRRHGLRPRGRQARGPHGRSEAPRHLRAGPGENGPRPHPDGRRLHPFGLQAARPGGAAGDATTPRSSSTWTPTISKRAARRSTCPTATSSGCCRS